jgi:hypothetical protein
MIWESITGIAGAVNATLEARREALRQQAEAQRERLEAWRKFQRSEAEAQQQLQRRHEAVRQVQQQLAALHLTEPALHSASAPAAQGFIATQRSEIQSELARIATQMAALPSALLADAESPLASMRRTLQRLQQSVDVSFAEIRSFHRTLNATLAEQTQLAERQAAQRQRLVQDTEELLTAVLQTRALNLSEEYDGPLAALQDQILAMLQNGVSTAALDILAQRHRTLKEQASRAADEAQLDAHLMQRLTHHLNDMGYQTECIFTATADGRRHDAQFVLPDGDRLRIALHADRRMAFQLSHATSAVVAKTLSGEALDFFRQQEARWCQDMRELVRRLVKDGMPFAVQFEREVPDTAIPLVVVESADELLDDEQEEQHRRHDKKHQERHRP